MIIFAMAALLAQPSAEDAAACATLQANAARENVPSRIDAVTEGLATTISCATRTVTFNKRVSVRLSEANAGWQETERQSWSAFVCNGPGFGPMARRGWRFLEHWTFRDGAQVTVEASCAGG